MNQFTKNSELILKTFLYQIVMSFFGIMIYSATSSNTLILIVGQSTVVLFFLYIMSSQSYRAGFKSAEFGRAHGIASPPALGFLLTLIAFLPTIALSLWAVLFPPFLANGEAQGMGYVPFLLNKTFLQGMYIGIVQWIFPTQAGGSSDALAIANALALNRQCYLYLAGAIPGFLASGLGYFIGHVRLSKDSSKK